MPLVFVGIAIIVLLLLMLWLKLDAFFSLLITCFVVGLLNSMGINDILISILNGIGDTLGNIVLIIVFGAMLGKIIEESGAANVISEKLIAFTGIKNIQYAILITGFLVGLPMMYNASFLVLIPLIYALSYKTKLSIIYLGIPLSATLSVAHAYLPPHPAPTYVSFVYGADLNLVLLYGLIPVIPACLIAGIVLSRFFKKVKAQPPKELFTDRQFSSDELPSLGRSLIVTVLPVLLMLTDALYKIMVGDKENLQGFDLRISEIVSFLGNPTVALGISVIVGLFLLGLRNGKNMSEAMKTMSKAVNAVAMIVMIIATGGALKQVLIDSGVTVYITEISANINFNPIVLGWCIAAVLRLAIGSATVATMTAAGIILPMVSAYGISPEVMVLATGSGSLMFSHFNDVGFWMFKEYFNVSIKETFAIWTTMECLVGIIGLIVALLINLFI